MSVNITPPRISKCGSAWIGRVVTAHNGRLSQSPQLENVSQVREGGQGGDCHWDVTVCDSVCQCVERTGANNCSGGGGDLTLLLDE